MKHRQYIIRLGAAAWLLLPFALGAGQVQDTMTISGFLAENVTLTVTSLDLQEIYRTTNKDKSFTSAITVLASEGLPYKVGIDAGLHCGTCQAAGDRMLVDDTSGQYGITYRIYKDVNHVAEWGDVDLPGGGTHHGETTDDVGKGNRNSSWYLYLRVDGAAPTYPSGNYSDVVTVKVTW